MGKDKGEVTSYNVFQSRFLKSCLKEERKELASKRKNGKGKSTGKLGTIIPAFTLVLEQKEIEAIILQVMTKFRKDHYPEPADIKEAEEKGASEAASSDVSTPDGECEEDEEMLCELDEPEENLGHRFQPSSSWKKIKERSEELEREWKMSQQLPGLTPLKYWQAQRDEINKGRRMEYITDEVER